MRIRTARCVSLSRCRPSISITSSRVGCIECTIINGQYKIVSRCATIAIGIVMRISAACCIGYPCCSPGIRTAGSLRLCIECAIVNCQIQIIGRRATITVSVGMCIRTACCVSLPVCSPGITITSCFINCIKCTLIDGNIC